MTGKCFIKYVRMTFVHIHSWIRGAIKAHTIYCIVATVTSGYIKYTDTAESSYNKPETVFILATLVAMSVSLLVI